MVRSHVREEELSRDEVVALEGEIDGAYEATPLPAMSYHKAVWAVLSVSEDILRTVADAQTFLQVRDELPEELKSGEHLSLKISDKLDGTKFALNEAIKSFRARLQRLPGRPKLTFEADDEKVAAFNFLSHSESYANAVRKFLGFHKGIIRVLKHDDHSAEFVESPESRPYSLLENLCWPERKRAAGDEKQSAIDVLVTELNSFADPNSIGREVASKNSGLGRSVEV